MCAEVGGRAYWHGATLHPAFALKDRRSFDGNWSDRTIHSGSLILRSVTFAKEEFETHAALW